VVWFRDRVRSDWFPWLRSGTIINGRQSLIESQGDLTSAYFNKTGGSDGERQSLNDVGQFTMRVPFADDSQGVYYFELHWPGDADGDHDVDFSDFAAMQQCMSRSSVSLPEDCDIFDFDADGDIDGEDFAVWLDVGTGPN
jgi:hypothetical protein